AGQRPLLEEHLGPAEGPLRAALLGQLLPLEWEYRLGAGERPRADEYEARFPGAAALIEALGREATAPARRTLPEPDLATRTSPGAARCFGAYELIEEVARGAMGVVFKARQKGLRRTVALKMVLAGARAAQADRQRSRTEAEAIARLQHPHIVQIHEVGEHDGLPYLVLEFCGGGSLAHRLAGTPLPPGEAAALAETLARAAQAAHDQGVIHRDLKPANVLLATGGREPPEDSEPPGGSRPPL